MKIWLAAGALCAALLWAAPSPDTFRFVILGDRTGEPEPGIYEKVWQQVDAEKPAFVVSVGDTIQGGKDATADQEWQDVEHTIIHRYPLYLAPGNHDIWSPLSEQLFVKYAAHPVHYSFDYGPAHFTILDNSRTDQFSPAEMTFLEEDLKAHADQPVKFIVSHRPSWIFNALMHDTTFPLHRLAKKYGVQYVIAGHVHEMMHFSVDGVEYVSMVSSGGHLRTSPNYESGWFFGYATVDIRKNEPNFQIHDIDGKTSALKDWGPTGLTQPSRP